MGFVFATEKEIGLEQLSDGRWLYKPRIIGKNISTKYLVSNDVRKKIVSSYKRGKIFLIVYATYLLSSLQHQKWDQVAGFVVFGILCVLYSNYRAKNFIKGCVVYTPEMVSKIVLDANL